MDAYLSTVGESDPQSAERGCLIGIGLGECKLVHVGGVFLRQEFFPAGQAVDESLDALQLADSLKGIIMSKGFHNAFNNNCPHVELVTEMNAHKDGFIKLREYRILDAGFIVENRRAPKNLLKK